MKTQLQLDSEWSEAIGEDGVGERDLAFSAGRDGELPEGGAFGKTDGGGGGGGGRGGGGDDFQKRCAYAFCVSVGTGSGFGGERRDGANGSAEREFRGTDGALGAAEPAGSLGNGASNADGGNGSDGVPEGESDESVLKRLNDGEQRAMGELWGRYAGLLFSQALRVLHNAAEAEDVVAEVFSEVWRRAGGYHPERARPAAWLVTLVRRRAIDRFRERRSHERAEERLALERGLGGDAGDGTEEQVRISELRRLLEQALARLPERQREAVCLVYFEGLTQREISKRTRTPIGTVKTRLELGLRKMRERIRGASLRPRMEEVAAGERCCCAGTEGWTQGGRKALSAPGPREEA